MRTILLLTDTPARTERLTARLAPYGPCTTVDLLDPDNRSQTAAAAAISVVVSDAALENSSIVAGLRWHVGPLKAAGVPFYCLLNEDTPRSRAQAQALGAAKVLRPDEVGQIVSRLAPPPAIDVSGAEANLTRMFDLGRSGGPIPPALIEAGAADIENALRQGDVRAWLDVVWRFDDATHQHCLLVAGLAAAFGREVGLAQADCQRLTQAALLHDVGKARIPLAILAKPGRLTPEERVVIETHTVLGHAMLAGQGYPAEMLAVVRSHHEYLDGTGYPDRLSGAEIPDLVRLVTICDIYGALLERRPYKAPVGADQAQSILEEMGSKLDQHLVRAFRPIAASSGMAAGPA